MRKLAVLLLSLTTLPTIAAEEAKSFGAEAEVGTLLTSGNTDSTTFKGKLNINHDLNNWLNNYVVEGLYSENEATIGEGPDAITESQVTAEKYFLSAQSDYKLNQEHRGLFMYGSYEDDKFSGYEYQGTIAGGYSDRLFETENTSLDFSAGPGVSFSKPERLGAESTETSKAAIVHLAGKFRWQISQNAKFTQTLVTDYTPDSDKNSKTKAESALTATLNGSFALKTGFTVTNNSVVPEDTEKTDTQTSVTLVYTY
ncbi:DUF481 domain-containing protein [Teredinibacter haidensis]|uniref:DUF481 domain-containing protein n=1 Tax=Teredinibacter haidensis TaxID=2731755 RepID=UPI000948D87B|nr:DUF481 domain-containing protein [Teredinibacter haidensis]